LAEDQESSFAAFDYHYCMTGSSREIPTVQQRLALLKQQERELRILFSQSHASLSDTAEIETKLVTLAAEIAELESAIPTRRSAECA
jgi:hypothetical protein